MLFDCWLVVCGWFWVLQGCIICFLVALRLLAGFCCFAGFGLWLGLVLVCGFLWCGLFEF